MSHEGHYVKLHEDPTFWAVDAGERDGIPTPEVMYEVGLRPVTTVNVAELDAIPVVGEEPPPPENDNDDGENDE